MRAVLRALAADVRADRRRAACRWRSSGWSPGGPATGPGWLIRVLALAVLRRRRRAQRRRALTRGTNSPAASRLTHPSPGPELHDRRDRDVPGRPQTLVRGRGGGGRQLARDDDVLGRGARRAARSPRPCRCWRCRRGGARSPARVCAAASCIAERAWPTLCAASARIRAATVSARPVDVRGRRSARIADGGLGRAAGRGLRRARRGDGYSWVACACATFERARRAAASSSAVAGRGRCIAERERRDRREQRPDRAGASGARDHTAPPDAAPRTRRRCARADASRCPLLPSPGPAASCVSQRSPATYMNTWLGARVQRHPAARARAARSSRAALEAAP